MDIRKVKIDSVRWVTDFTGVVKPMLLLKTPIRYSGGVFDAIALPNNERLLQGINENQILKIKIKNNSIDVLHFKRTQGKKLNPIPSFCPSCFGEVGISSPEADKKGRLYYDTIICTNDMCTSKSLSQVFKLLEFSWGELDIPLFKEYTENFKPFQSTEPIIIDTLFELFMFFESNEFMKVVKTTALNTDRSYEILELEKKLVEKLEHGLTDEEFWKMLNMDTRGFSKEQLDRLYKTSYRNILDCGMGTALRENFLGHTDDLELLRTVIYLEPQLKKLVNFLDKFYVKS